MTGAFTLSSATTLELQLRASAAGTYGVPANFAENEIFVVIKVTKIGE